MIVIGVDPGLTGAMAFYDADSDEVFATLDMPLTDRMYGSGSEIDWPLLRDQIEEIIDLMCETREKDLLAAIENVGVMPKQGAVSGFQFGRVIGGLESMFAVMRISQIKVHPATWKKRFGLVGTDKQACLDMVKATYPEANLSLKKHHNRADAIAIAVAGSKMV